MALALIAGIILVVALVGPRRDATPPPTTTAPASRPVAAPALRAGAITEPTAAAPALGPRRLPPPPADFHDGGLPAPAIPGAAERRLAAGEFPLRPPGFAAEHERAAFRAWGLDEFGRRAELYREHHPSDDYPSAEDTARLLERFYDLGEPPRPGETADDLDLRQQAWFEAWSDLTAAFGTPPKTILSFGGDPQYGGGAPPPVVPGTAPPAPDPSRPTMPEDEVPAQTPPLGPARRR